jgi:hypothetical protein
MSSKRIQNPDDQPLGALKVLFSRWKFILLIMVLMFPLKLSIGNSNSKLTVMNKTEQYLHIFIEGAPYLYISPNRSVTAESGGFVTFTVTAFYSPGQNIKGSITRDITVEPLSPGSAGCDYDRGEGCDCTTTPAVGGSEIWEITADSLQVD